MAVNDYDQIFEDAGREWNVDPTLLKSIAHVESGGNSATPDSYAGAQGLMQIMPPTGKSLGVNNARDPAQAIFGSAKLLNQLLTQFGNVSDALRAYNAGPDTSHWNNSQTIAYVPKVAAAYQQYAPQPAPRGTAVAGPGGPSENDTIIANAVDRLRPAPGRMSGSSPNAADQQGQDDPFSQIMRAAQGGGTSDSSSAPDVVAPPSGGAASSSATAGGSSGQTDDDPFSKIMRSAQAPDASAQTSGMPSGAPAPSSASSAQASAPVVTPHPAPDGSGSMTNLSDADFWKFKGSAPATPQLATPAAQMPPSAVPDITTFRPQDIATLDRAAHDMTDVPAQLLARGADAVGLNRLIGAPTAADVAAGNANALASYNQQYGNNPILQGIRTGLDVAGAAIPSSLAARGVTAGGEALLGGGRFANALISPAAGAAAGAAGNLAVAGASNQPVGQQVAQGALLGGALGATAPVVGSIGSGLNRLAAPFSEAGRGKIADDTIAAMARGGPTAVNDAPLVPGSIPTLAQATANPGIATLERNVKSIPTQAGAFVQRAQENSAAREAAMAALKGDDVSLDNLVQARAQAALATKDSAFQNASPVDPTPVVQQIDKILASPSGQRDTVKAALTNIRSKLTWQTQGPNGQPIQQMQQDPAQLYGIRQALTDMMSPAARGTSSDARLASAELNNVKDALDPVIEQGAPGYRNFLATYADMSKPIDAQQLLQRMNIADSRGNITLGGIDRAIKQIETQQALPGPRAAKSIPDAVMNQLYGIRDDLRREGNSLLGKAAGSDTVQNLATAGMMNRMGVPLSGLAMFTGHHIPAAMMYLGKMAYGAQNQKILDELTNRLLDARLGANALTGAPIAGSAYRPLLPLATTTGNALIPQSSVSRGQ